MSKSNKLIVLSVFLATMLIMTSTSNVLATTQWGIETGFSYKFSLKKLYMGGDLTPFLKSNTTLEIKFTDINDTGYTYDVYNATGVVAQEQSTVFVTTETDIGDFILPEGLPIALPLSIDQYSNYMNSLANFINQSAQNIEIIAAELQLNLSEIGSNITISAYATINTQTFNINLDGYASELNSTLVELLSSSFDTGDLPITIPTNITDFKLNVTLSYSATTGLFNNLLIKIRSKAVQYGFLTDFNVDLEYGQEISQNTSTNTETPSVTTTTRTESTSFMVLWGAVALSIVSLSYITKREGKI